MKPIILLFVSICISFLLHAQVSKTVNITVGGLKTNLTTTELSTVTNLTGRVTSATISSFDLYDFFHYSIALNWSAPLSETPPLSYTVYYCDSEDGSFSSYSTTETTYLFDVPPIETPYWWFYVTAVYETGESAPTSKLSIQPDVPIITVDGATISATLAGKPWSWDSWNVEMHWYKFYAPFIPSGDNIYYDILANGGLDLTMELYKGDMNTLVKKDMNSIPYYNAQLGVTNSPGEWYYVNVRAFEPGNYNIGVKTLQGQPYNNLFLDCPYEAKYNLTSEPAEYRFVTGASGIYTIQTNGSLNTVLSLYDATGFIEQDDEDGEGSNALIQRNLEANTEYIVRMTASSIGDYLVGVKAPIMTLIVDDQCYSSTIVYENETDWYKFQTGAAGYYYIKQSVNSPIGIRLYESDTTTLIALDLFIWELGPTQRIESILSANTLYYIKVNHSFYRPSNVVNSPYCIGVTTAPFLTVSPISISLDCVSGSTGIFNITSNTSWSITNNASWLDMSTVSDINNATVTVTANSANTGTNPRTATITIVGTGVTPDKTVTVTQNGGCETTQQNYLNYCFANPRIINGTGYDSFEFDIQVKANVAGTYLWSGMVNLSFDNATLSIDPSQWIVTKAGQFNANNSHGNPKYGIDLTITGTSSDKILNIGFSGDSNALNDPPTSADFVEVTNSYQTLVTVSAQITDENGVAGIDFIEANMNGKQFCKISSNPYYAAYTNPNVYGEADFIDTYVGRIFSNHSGWTQIGSLDYASAVNTSVWDGSVTGPNNSYFNATSLRIHNPAQLKIPLHGQMTVTGDTEIKTINGLIIQSEDQYTGSFITGTASGVGSALTERYMKTDAWHIVSSPLAGQSITDFLTSNPNIATSEDNEVRGMMDYNPGLNEWNDYFTNSTAENLETGKGFCMRTNVNSAVTFTGSLRAGPVSLTGLIPEKWNCIGNPYTSAIGLNRGSQSTAKFLDENESRLDDSYGAIYVWLQPYSAYGPDGMYIAISNVYEEYDLVRVDISPGQGFFVKLKSGVTSINFNPEMQHHNTEPFFKSAQNSWPIIKLIASVNSQKSSTTIAFNQGMTRGLDKTYDAGLFKGGSDLVVYSRLVEDNGIPFAIQALPDNDFGSTIIPIGLDFNTGGDVVFTADLINLPSDCQVILEDKISKTFTDLSNKDYTATIAANSSIADRFRLHTSYLTTGLDTKTLDGKLSAYAIRNVEMIVRGDVSSEAVASVYDLLGRMILTKQLDAGNRNVIDLPMLKTGIYMLHVRDNGKEQAFKVMVKE